jgi:hypothetical protein
MHWHHALASRMIPPLPCCAGGETDCAKSWLTDTRLPLLPHPTSLCMLGPGLASSKVGAAHHHHDGRKWAILQIPKRRCLRRRRMLWRLGRPIKRVHVPRHTTVGTESHRGSRVSCVLCQLVYKDVTKLRPLCLDSL